MAKTTEQFIEEAKLKHGERYDYTNTKYISCKKKIVIECKIHGEFEQFPNNHLKSNGCYKCKKTNFDKRKTTEKFIEESKLKHGDKFD